MMASLGQVTHLRSKVDDKVLGDFVARLHRWHELGWRHRDVHAGNVLVKNDDTKAWLIDYGTASTIGNPATDPPRALDQILRDSVDPLRVKFIKRLIESKWLPADAKLTKRGEYELSKFVALFDAGGKLVGSFGGESTEEILGPRATTSASVSSRVASTGRGSMVVSCLAALGEQRPCVVARTNQQGAAIRQVDYLPPHSWVVTWSADASPLKKRVLQEPLSSVLRKISAQLGWDVDDVRIVSRKSEWE